MNFAVTGHRPDEASALQAFDEQAQAILIGLQHFNHVSTAATKDKEMTTERVVFQDILHF